LYIARWLRAPVQRPDGTLEQRTRGTPQGGVVTPRTQKVTFSLIG
jgi:RNA-directed DNA polymerase